MLFAIVVFGAVEPFMPADDAGTPLALLETFTMTVSLAYWCYLDAKTRGRELARWLLWTVAILGFIALPLYFFITRTPGQAMIAIAKALVFSAFALGLFAVVAVSSNTLLCRAGYYGDSCPSIF